MHALARSAHHGLAAQGQGRMVFMGFITGIDDTGSYFVAQPHLTSSFLVVVPMGVVTRSR